MLVDLMVIWDRGGIYAFFSSGSRRESGWWARLTAELYPELAKGLIAKPGDLQDRRKYLSFLEDGFGTDADII